MIEKINFPIPELQKMKKYPDELFYIGENSLLKKPKISIVGTRKPITYTKLFTAELAKKLSLAGVVVVSGGAMGVDAIAHQNSLPNTISVMANGLSIHYPAINKNLICEIEKRGLVLSSYPNDATAKAYTFVQRNELVVALGEVLIITQADSGSGSLRSAEFALKMGKKIFVLPHRIGESEGTNGLLKRGFATPIFSVDSFLDEIGYGIKNETLLDPFLQFCKTNPTYDEAVEKFGGMVFEYELMGTIQIQNGIVVAI